MRLVVALGGNALAKRGELISAENQRKNIALAGSALADIARHHELIVTHGNGPQVGLLALQNKAYTGVPAYPLDILGAQTQGMIGYLIELELRNALGPVKQLTTILTLVEVSPSDPAFLNPEKFVGPTYTQEEAQALIAQFGWQFRSDGATMRRVVPSPKPVHVVQLDAIRDLLEDRHVVIACGGGGVPVTRDAEGRYQGAEVVIDKDGSSALLAAEVDADLFVIATDAPAVMLDWGTPNERAIAQVTPDQLRSFSFAAGSMGPKVEAACQFVSRTGKSAAIGRLEDLAGMVAGTHGTIVVPNLSGSMTFK